MWRFNYSWIPPVRCFLLMSIWGACVWPALALLPLGRQETPPESPVYKVSVTGPKEVIRGGNEYLLTIHLEDENGNHVGADSDREIRVAVVYGSIDPRDVLIAEGEKHVDVLYRSPDAVVVDTVTAESRDAEVGDWTILVVTATFVLLLAAGIGGVLGGWARLYTTGTTRLMPRVTEGKLELGLIGGGLYSSVFGVVLFLGAKFGIIQILDLLGQGGGLYTRTRSFAFFFGVLGGFGGTYILERLLHRVLPKGPGEG